jgi:hypothetical protein
LDPVTKLAYLEAAWEKKYIAIGMKCLQKQVSLYPTYEYLHLDDVHFLQFLVYKTRYEASQKDQMVVQDDNQQVEISELVPSLIII